MTDNSIINLKNKIMKDINVLTETVVTKDMFQPTFNCIIDLYKCLGIIINKNDITLKSHDDIVSNDRNDKISRMIYGSEEEVDINPNDLLYSDVLSNLTGRSTLGTYNGKTKDITMKPNVKLGNFVSTMAHELIHAYIHQKNIKVCNSYKPSKEHIQKYSFSFQNKFYMNNGDVEEGICELLSLIVMEILFGKKVTCSTVSEYWYGWRTMYAAYSNIWEKESNKQIKNYTKHIYLIITLSKLFEGITNENTINDWMNLVPINEKKFDICHNHLL